MTYAPWSICELRRLLLLILPLPSASIPFHLRWIQWRRRHRESARQFRYRKLGLLPITRGRTIDSSLKCGCSTKEYSRNIRSSDAWIQVAFTRMMLQRAA